MVQDTSDYDAAGTADIYRAGIATPLLTIRQALPTSADCLIFFSAVTDGDPISR